jgi:hypothetical protein
MLERKAAEERIASRVARSIAQARIDPPNVRIRFEWSAAWLLCVSQPPRRVKKTSVGRPAASICAMSLN